MIVDRLLIGCSVADLVYLVFQNGFACYTPFQWMALALLATKLFLVLRRWWACRPIN